MAAVLLSPEKLAGVYEKLKRAEEGIGNLDSQIVAFLRERPEGGLNDDKQKAAKELVEFHAKRVIPLRFAVIAGEIIDHLGSSLEYIAWMLSTDAYRRDHPTRIGFPIKETKPATRDELTSYDRQVKGILDNGARDLIERLQPYNAANPADDPLTILHELHRENKHRTLPLIVAPWKMQVTIPTAVFRTFIISGFDTEKEWLDPALTARSKLEFSLYVAFDKIGRWKGESVIPVLTELANKISVIVGRFAELRI
ncbi:MAG TPA: hypothetical protein VIH89_16055 [Candidatus Sulfotelmatobacter sp.]